MNRARTSLGLVTALATAGVVSPLAGYADDGNGDFGKQQELLLRAQSERFFGFGRPLSRSATDDDVIPREEASASERQFLARGLRARFVARNVASLGDMIAFWPTDIDYSHLIVCIEQGRSGTTPGGNSGLNAAVQRVDVGTGEVETILHGMSRCDGIRTTQWGTVLATEETDDGAAYEIIDPLTTTGHWIADRGGPGLAADIRDGIDSPSPSQQVVKRTALATQAWEGLDVLDNGVVIGGDELRSGDDNDGGAIFRFVPSVFYACQGAPVRPGQLCDNTISDLSQSPLVSGANYALYHGCNGVGDQGQGCEYGDEGRWVKVNAATARADANLHGATGYCRPEDLHIDRSFGLFDNRPEEGIRWCWTNTCGGSDGEAICAFESSDAVNASLVASLNTGPGIFEFLSTDGSALAEVDTQRFVEADEAGLDLRLSSHDNLDIQPHTSNTYIIEDTSFGDVWACLPDGGDNNERTDGCVAMLSVRDPSAEPTGFVFDGTGQVAFYILQHGQQADSLRDFASNPVDGATDDLVKITGFRVPGDRGRRYSWWD